MSNDKERTHAQIAATKICLGAQNIEPTFLDICVHYLAGAIASLNDKFVDANDLIPVVSDAGDEEIEKWGEDKPDSLYIPDVSEGRNINDKIKGLLIKALYIYSIVQRDEWLTILDNYTVIKDPITLAKFIEHVETGSKIKAVRETGDWHYARGYADAADEYMRILSSLNKQ